MRRTLAVVVGVLATLVVMAGPVRADDNDPYSTSSCEVSPPQVAPEGCNSQSTDPGTSVLGEQQDRGTRVLGVQVSRGALAVTGSDILVLVAVAGVAILAGFGFRTVSRRRTS